MLLFDRSNYLAFLLTVYGLIIMDEKMDLVSYICNGSSTTLPDVLFDGNDLPDDWMEDSSTHDLLHENFNLGNSILLLKL